MITFNHVCLLYESSTHNQMQLKELGTLLGTESKLKLTIL